MSDKVIIPQGFKVGHAQNDKTGVTVILCEDGAVGGVDVRGCAPGTRETDLLRPEKAIEKVNAVALCGGSAYGLDSLGGVMQYLRERNIGHKMGPIVVPLVAGAVIFDLNEGKYNFPDAKTGYSACENAEYQDVKFGAVGAGTGATVGKILGAQFACRGGVGASTIISDGAVLTAVAVVNAVGDVYDPETGAIVAGAHTPDGQFLNTKNFILSGKLSQMIKGANTTLVCIMTDAKLTKLQANKLSSIAHNGLAQTIKPVHTDYDGDTVFTLSRGEKEVDFTVLSCVAVEAVSQAILDAVKQK